MPRIPSMAFALLLAFQGTAHADEPVRKLSPTQPLALAFDEFLPLDPASPFGTQVKQGVFAGTPMLHVLCTTIERVRRSGSQFEFQGCSVVAVPKAPAGVPTFTFEEMVQGAAKDTVDPVHGAQP